MSQNAMEGKYVFKMYSASDVKVFRISFVTTFSVRTRFCCNCSGRLRPGGVSASSNDAETNQGRSCRNSDETATHLSAGCCQCQLTGCLSLKSSSSSSLFFITIIHHHHLLLHHRRRRRRRRHSLSNKKCC